jgi:excisionase family DNA binding protein
VKKLLTRAEVAERLGCTTRHVSSLVANGVLPKVEIGGLLRFLEDDLDALIKRSTTTAPKAPGAEALDELVKPKQGRPPKRT